MNDGYCGLYDAENEHEARQKAIAATREAIKGAAMNAKERRAAVAVEAVECLMEATDAAT
jgi:hypothetical protein